MAVSNQWKGKRICVIGAARQGLALARFFLLQGADVILNDRSDSAAMQPVIDQMSAWQLARQPQGSLTWHLASHPLELLENLDLLCVSGGVPLNLPIIEESIRRHIPLSNDSELFMQSVQGQVIGISGSAGKTTTTALLGKIVSDALENTNRKVWVGGNIGTPLIEQTEEIRPEDVVVLELSSFQLELMRTVPPVAAILNITPNHLDRHGTMEAYTAAKANLFRGQKPGDWAIINHEDPGANALRAIIPGQLASFGFRRSPGDHPQVYQSSDQLHLFTGTQEMELLNINDIKLRGRHNILNVMAALLLAHCAQISLTNIHESVTAFTGVPHRLEYVREHKGVQWYNDSIATTPERSMAAIRSFSEPLVLLLGGRDKDLPWEHLASLVHRRVHDVILFGEAAQTIEPILRRAHSSTSLVNTHTCPTLQEAVTCAATVAQPGDVVLLSPGGTSFDEFIDFAERGERYKQWVQQIS
jgi:UDP-N-acetylmuramoylalanine--D-glutamate ligase